MRIGILTILLVTLIGLALSGVYVKAFFWRIASNSLGNTIIEGLDATKVNNGLLNYWTFNEEDVIGATARDKVLNGNNGTITGAVIAEGVVNQGLDFDGTNDLVDMGDDDDWDFAAGDFALVTWVNKQGNSVGSPYVIAKWNDVSGVHQFKLAMTNGVSTIQICYEKTNLSEVCGITGSLLTDNTGFYHIVAQRSGNSFEIYIDGQIVVDTESGTHGTMRSTATVFRVGNDEGDTKPFNGVIDEVRIYNRTLTSTEVINLFNQRSKATITVGQNDLFRDSLVSLWSFNGPDINFILNGTSTAIDRSGSNNGSISPRIKFVPGIIGQSLDFNTRDLIISQFIDTNATVLNTTGNFTISIWIKPSKTDLLQDIISELGPENTAGQYILRQTANGQIRFFRRDGVSNNTNSITAGTILTQGKWTHIACGYDGSLFCYFNGVEGTTASADLAITGQLAVETWIGNGNSQTSNVYKGLIDEVRLYNKALTATEIQEIFIAGYKYGN